MIGGRFANLKALNLYEGLSDLSGGGRLRLFGLWGGARALVLGEIDRSLKRPLVVVTATLKEAEEITTDLRFFLDRDRVELFPEPDSPPFSPISPPLDVRAERIKRLRELRDGELSALVLPAHALFRRLLPPEDLDGATMHVYPHRIVPPEQVVHMLDMGGYQAVPQVEQAGEYSRRGGILDIGLPHLPHPVRLEFFGDEIESIRTFDVQTQRSLGTPGQSGVAILPLSEILLRPESRELARQRSKEKRSPLLRDAIEAGRFGPGLERYLPYFCRRTVPLWEYLSREAILVWDDPDQVAAKGDAVEGLMEEQYHRHAREGLPPLTSTHLRWKEIRTGLASKSRIDLVPFSPAPGQEAVPFLFETRPIPSYRGRFAPLVRDLERWRRDGHAITLVARGTTQAQRLCEVLQGHDLGASVNGSTSTDRTNYFETVPSHHLELALWPEFAHLGNTAPHTQTLHPTSV